MIRVQERRSIGEMVNGHIPARVRMFVVVEPQSPVALPIIHVHGDDHIRVEQRDFFQDKSG